MDLWFFNTDDITAELPQSSELYQKNCKREVCKVAAFCIQVMTSFAKLGKLQMAEDHFNKMLALRFNLIPLFILLLKMHLHKLKMFMK